MTRFTLFLAVLMTCFAAVTVSAAPNLYVNGTLLAPWDTTSFGWQDLEPTPVTFTLISEQTVNRDHNSFYLHQDWNSATPTQLLFEGSDGAGTVKTFTLCGETMGFSMLSDVNGNGVFDPDQGESWANSMTMLNNPTSSYQWLRPYDPRPFGYAHYYFDDGGLDFWGDYDFLLCIDDGPIAGGSDFDHNDMVIGINEGLVTPEPSTLILLLLGIAGLFAFRHFRS